MLHIVIDADSCPVKPEVYRVAERYHVPVTLVANAWMRTPKEEWIKLVVVGTDFDAADDRIVAIVQASDIVVTTDILLANRCLKKDAHAISPTGKRFTESNIGMAVATRELMNEMRNAGEITGGPPPLTKRDRSCFLQQLDILIQSTKNTNDR